VAKPYYEHAGITIYHGDCREILPSIKADLLCTDPPYGINIANMHEDSGRQPGKAAAPKGMYENSLWDMAPVDQGLLDLAISTARHAIVFGGNYFRLPPARCVLVWDKDNGTNQFADCELAWTNLDKPVRLKRHMWNGMLREGDEARYDHPTQKPVAVMMWAILHAPDTCQTILDPFMGSGTTLVAAKNLGRRACGIEIEEKYCEIAARRLSQEVFDFGEAR
jgi:DNA modification methylase